MALGLKGLAAVPAEPIPLSVLTGFLGSGKTTFLGRVLASPDLADTAVVISEFGAVALDHLLIEAESEGIVDLPNADVGEGGCVAPAASERCTITVSHHLPKRKATPGSRPTRTKPNFPCRASEAALSASI